MTYDKIKAKVNRTRSIIGDTIKAVLHDKKKMVIVIILTISLVLVASYFVFRDTHEFTQKDLDRILENKKMLECATCHTPGQNTVVARDTIDMSSSCYQCHREDIDFFVPVTKDVHIYHKGDPSILPGYPSEIDYSTRHKDILGSCDTCHVYASDQPPMCVKCHSGEHIEQKKGFVCGNCHGSVDSLFRHSVMRFETHNIFGNESCNMCHSSDKIMLELANGNKVSIAQSSDLCKQCHSGTYKEWTNGNHLSSVGCVVCHNPHYPKYVNQTIIDIAKDISIGKKAEETPVKPADTSIIPRRKYDYDTVQE